MRRFSSYGQIDTEQHYYAPRTELIDFAYTQLIGEKPERGGHYITVWAPRQTGKSGTMLEVTKRLRAQQEFDIALMTMEFVKGVTDSKRVLHTFVSLLRQKLQIDFPEISTWEQLATLFSPRYLSKPLILILDEFDALHEEFIHNFASEFRAIRIEWLNEPEKKSHEKNYLLHGLALIGVRSVLGIENVSGSPFNVQRSVHIPNLTFEEVKGMFKWYEQENGQHVESEVLEQLYYETNGQPGLVCWFGELLTEGFEDYQPDKNRPISRKDFEAVYAAALQILPNNTILNILSKAKQEPYNQRVLEFFRVGEQFRFRYDKPDLNYLYFNGVIAPQKTSYTEYYVKFASPFVQKRLFNYFAGEIFDYVGKVCDPFEPLEHIINQDRLHIPNLMKRFQLYLQQNRAWLLDEAPRRKDLRIFEAVYHFALYRYLYEFLKMHNASVYPEFPTGNGKIDLIITYKKIIYGLELKSYTNASKYNEALEQAAKYGKQLGLDEIFLVVFVEYIDDTNRTKLEKVYQDQATGVTVTPVFGETGR